MSSFKSSNKMLDRSIMIKKLERKKRLKKQKNYLNIVKQCYQTEKIASSELNKTKNEVS